MLLDQQTSLRLMQADPSHDIALLNRHAPEITPAESRKTAKKTADITPWESSVGPPVHSYHSAQLFAKGRKRLKKVPLSKQHQLEIPPALTALLQTVKQVSFHLHHF